MVSGPERIPADFAASRLRALATGGVGPGLPRKRRDQWILLHAAAQALGPNPLDERSLNERLKAWLVFVGARVEIDHVTLRRALVDDGFVERDANGASYRRSEAFEQHVVFEEEVVMESNPLAGERCIACHPDAPRLSTEEIAALLRSLPGWSVADDKGEKRLVRVYKFKDFTEALAFTNRVGAIAEAEDHHPALLTEWGRVTVSWWTHAIGGLHRNDFVMAAKTDGLQAA